MSLLFDMLSRFVITFLPRSKRLLISWLQSPSVVILEPPKIKSTTVSTVSSSICHEVMWPDAMILVFWILSFKPTFSLSSFTLIKSLLVIHFLPKGRCHLHIWGYLLAILIPVCASSRPVFLMMYSAYTLNNTDLTYSFSCLEPVCCSMSSSKCGFLTCFSRGRSGGLVFPSLSAFSTVYCDPHKDFGIVNKAEIDVFLELLLFLWSSGCWQFDLWFLCFL